MRSFLRTEDRDPRPNKLGCEFSIRDGRSHVRVTMIRIGRLIIREPAARNYNNLRIVKEKKKRKSAEPRSPNARTRTDTLRRTCELSSR